MSDPVAVWSWIFLIASLVLFMALGYVGMRRTKNADDFAVARSSYGPWVLGLAVVATVASGVTFLGAPGLAYSQGFPTLWYSILYPPAIYLGMLMSARLVKTMGDRFGNRSIPDFVGSRYNSEFLRLGMTLVSFLLLFYVASQLVAAAALFQVMLGLPYVPALLLTAAVLLVYVAMGGSHADILTDAVQGLLMLTIAIGVAVLFFVGYGVDGGVSAVNEAVAQRNATSGWDTFFIAGDPTYGSAWLVAMIFVAYLPFGVLPHIGNKFMALGHASQMRKFMMFCIVAGGILPLISLGGLLGAATIDREITPDQVIPVLFTEAFPPVVAALLAVTILSAVFSTSDGVIVSISQLLANDLYRKTFARNVPAEVADRRALAIGRVGVALALLGGVALSWNPPESLVMLLWVGIGGLVAGLAGPVLIGSLWRRATKTAAITSFVVGVVGYALIYLPFWDPLDAAGNPFAAAGYSVLIASAVMVATTLLTKPMPEEFLARVFGDARRPTSRPERQPASGLAESNGRQVGIESSQQQGMETKDQERR
jgi:Na+/proline symporter